jgi:hypothetical protein
VPHSVARVVVADYILISVIVAPSYRQFLHVEPGLLQFFDGRFSGRVRWVDRNDGIIRTHLFYLLFFSMRK